MSMISMETLFGIYLTCTQPLGGGSGEDEHRHPLARLHLGLGQNEIDDVALTGPGQGAGVVRAQVRRAGHRGHWAPVGTDSALRGRLVLG